MALYPGAVLKLIAPGNDGPITPRVVILHVAVSQSDSLYDQFLGNQRPGASQIESHFYIRYSGVVEQYRDTGWRADANMDANPFAISVETEGLAAGQWTPEQMAAIKALLLWLHEVHPIPLVKCPKWDGAGVGYHILFMTQWAGGPRSCPGPDRIVQFNSVLVPWLAHPTAPTGADMPLNADDLAQIRKAISEEVAKVSVSQGYAGAADAGGMLNKGYRQAVQDAAKAAMVPVLAQMGAPHAGVDVDALADAVAAKLVAGTTVTVTGTLGPTP